MVPALASAGHQVACLLRSSSSADTPTGRGIQTVVGDVTDGEAVRRGLEGADAVVHLAGVNMPDLEACRQINVDGVKTIIEACRATGVRRVVANSTVSATREHLGAYGLTKRESEELWQASGLDVSILRFSLVYGQDERSVFGRMVKLVTAFPLVPVVGPGTYEVQPVHVDDVSRAILSCLDRPASAGRAYVLAGREPTTFDQLVDGILSEKGQRKPKLHIPVPVALLMARAMAKVMPNPPLSVDNILGMNQPTDYDISAAERELGFDPRPLGEGLKEALGNVVPDRPGAVRIAVVGLGRMGLAHAALVNQDPSAQLVALCDRQARLGKQARGTGLRVPFYQDLVQMLDEAKPAGVLVCTPPNSHLPLARACLERGVGVLVEKPLAESLEAASQMAALLDEHPVAAAVGYQYAHAPVYRRAKALLQDGTIGRPLRVKSSAYLSQVLGAKKKSWWYEPAVAGGGVVASVTSHLLLLLVQSFGPAEWAAAETRRVHSEAVEDEADITLGFASGLEATVTTSWSVPGYEKLAIEIQIEGEQGTLKVTNRAIELELERPAGAFRAGSTRVAAAELPDPAAFELGGLGFAAEDAEFVAAVAGGQPPTVSWRDGLAVQKIIDAVYRSAAGAGKVVLHD